MYQITQYLRVKFVFYRKICGPKSCVMSDLFSCGLHIIASKYNCGESGFEEISVDICNRKWLWEYYIMIYFVHYNMIYFN